MSRKKEDINVKLLIDTLSVQTVSNNDAEMMVYIKDFLTVNKIPYKTDNYGNIYATKGTGPYVAFVSHTDTVHKVIDDFQVFKANDIIFGFNGTTGRQYGIGGKTHCHPI